MITQLSPSQVCVNGFTKLLAERKSIFLSGESTPQQSDSFAMPSSAPEVNLRALCRTETSQLINGDLSSAASICRIALNRAQVFQSHSEDNYFLCSTRSDLQFEILLLPQAEEQTKVVLAAHCDGPLEASRYEKQFASLAESMLAVQKIATLMR